MFRRACALSLLSLSFPFIASAGSQIYSTPGTSTFTVPQNVSSITVEVWGAGGGGGGGGWSGSYGGGGGGYSKKTFNISDLPSTVTVTVGAGGAGGGTSAWTGGCYGYGSGYAGSSGSDSSFGSYLSAGGGAPGGANSWAGMGGGGGGAGGSGVTENGGTGGIGMQQQQDYSCDEFGNCGYTMSYTSTPGGSATNAGGGGGGENPNWTVANGNCLGDAGPGGSSQNGGKGGHSAYAKYWCQIDADPGAAPGGGGGGGNEPVSNNCSQMYAATTGAQGGNGQVKISWTAPLPTCNVSFDQNPLTGNSTTIHWSSTNANLFYINGVGYVSANGSATVYNPGDYGGIVTGDGGTNTCTATLGGTANQCVDGGTPGTPGTPGTVTEATTPTVITLTSGSSWTVPSDWNSSHNSIEVIGAGATGATGMGGGTSITYGYGQSGGTGGGGGAYSKVTNVQLTVGGTISYAIGQSGQVGGDTYLCNSASNCSSIAGGAVVAGAKGASGANGGTTSGGVGAVKYAGGNGGTSGGASGGDWAESGGGGGGAGRSAGAGTNGGGGGLATGGSAGSVGGGTGGNGVRSTVDESEDCGQAESYNMWQYAGNPGSNAASYGGGGGGGSAGGTVACSYAERFAYGNPGSGGNGKQGEIIITYYALTSTDGTHGTDGTPGGGGSGGPFTCGTDGNLHDSCGNTTTCPYGCSTTTNQCKPKAQCTSFRVCDTTGMHVVNSCDGSLVDDCTTYGAGYSCVAGACVVAPIGFQSFAATRGSLSFTATGHLQVSPSLVRMGDRSNVYWNVINAKSCTVTSNSLDSWTGLFSGATGKQSVPIMHQTIYTLHCDAPAGVTPASIEETATVNILPMFQEQ